jgi:RNA polymerase sigma factor (sigma-70 family)
MSLLKGSTPSILLHIRRGAPVNGRDDRDLTPLMLAASAGRHDICLLLLAEGADPSLMTSSGQTASDLAMTAGYYSLGDALRPARPVPSSQLASAPHQNPGVMTRSETSDDDAFGDVVATFSTALMDDGWETEEAFTPVVDDSSVAIATRQVQAVLATPRGENDDASWQDIRVALPSRAGGPRRGLARGIIPVLAKAITTGRMPATTARRVARRIEGLGAILEDLGVQQESVFESSISHRFSQERAGTHDEDRLADAAELVAALEAGRSASEYYEQEVRRLPPVDRAGEQSMFRALAEAKRQVVRSLIACVPAVEDVLRQEMIGTTPDETEDDERDDDVVEDPAAGEVVDGTLLSALLAVRDGEWSADVETLAEIELDFGVVEAVGRALESTAQGTERAARLRLTGDRYLAVRDRVIEANLALVLKAAPRFRRPGVDVADLVQEGNIGLMRAVERYDVARGNRFATYAMWWVRQAITRSIADKARTIRIPVHMIETMNMVDRKKREMLREIGRAPTPEELAEQLAIPLEKVRKILKIVREPTSLSTSIGGHEGRYLCDSVEDKTAIQPIDAAIQSNLIERTAGALVTLTPREERVLRMRFGFHRDNDLTLEEVGQLFSVTRERIRQVEAKALRRLKHPSRSRTLRSFLDS